MQDKSLKRLIPTLQDLEAGVKEILQELYGD
jgi:hypothetical protein